MKKIIFTILSFCVFSFHIKAQLITEDFTYTGAMTANGWTGNNTNAPISTTTPGLAYSIYSGSNVGNAASIVPGSTNQYVTKSFTLPASGDLYYAAMINVPASNTTATTGDYVLGFFQNNATRGRLWLQNQAGGGFKLAVGKTSSTSAPVYSTTTFSAGTTHLVVVKYSIVSGTANDSVSLYVDPVINGVENGLVYSSNTDAGTDLGSSPSLQISQRINLPSLTIDGIRLSTSWAEILSQPNTAFYYKGTGNINSLSSWGSNPDGTGTSPTSFTLASQSFNIANTTNVTLSGSWSVSGANSKIILPLADTLKAIAGGTIGSSVIDVAGAFTTDNFTFPTWGNVSGSILIDNAAGINVGGAAIITLPSFLAGGDFILLNGDVNMGNNDLTVNGKLQISGNNKFYGAGAFILSSTGTLRIGNPSGISSGAATMTGAIQMTTSRYFDPAASYSFIGTGTNLITGDGLPQTITGTLTIKLVNATDIITLTQSIIGNAGSALYPTVSTLSGRLKLGNNSIILSSMVNGSSSGYVITDGTGALTRPVSNTGGSSTLAKNFYVGTTSEYRLISVTFPLTIGTPTSTNVTVRYVSGNPGSNGYPAGILAHSTTGSWKLGFSVAPTNTYTLAIETVGMAGSTALTGARILQRVAAGTNAWDITSANTAAAIAGTVLTETLVNVPAATTYDIALGLTAVLPVSITNFSASKQNNNAAVNWSTAFEQNNAYFNIQRSNTGVDFTTIGRVNGKGNSTVVANYQFTDFNLPNADLYYRLQQVDANGKATYSSIVLLRNSKANTSNLNVYPNPIKVHQATLAITDLQEGTYTILVRNLSGATVYSKNIQITSAQTSVQLILPSSLSKGLYLLELKDASKDGIFKISKNIIVD